VKVLEGPIDAASTTRRRYPGMRWEPKAAFDALAEGYGR
jgi:hypothetical protein